jgi:hypothetical protein
MKKVVMSLCETTSENYKCHLHIHQPRKCIYVLNIIVENILEKRKNEGKGTPKALMPPTWV